MERRPARSASSASRRASYSARIFRTIDLRVVPIAPEVIPLLEQQFDRAAEGEELVLPGMLGEGDGVYGKRLKRVVKKLGLDQ
ncbi:hypothetical protein PLANPX_2839 [Lacipirellula parvula]|uniref:Uncharacterized protein n=1 Tax=Lacipirellula parvula TaxID=2650471 RepID=A0A5K7XB43_9BACT|nr:hypothetical protein PLANPX_2839 [Lacipirellula parvula]